MDEVPLSCLLSTCCLVSRAWRDIISNPLYLPWAKRYYAYKLRRQGAECAKVPPAFIVQAYLDHFFEEVGAAEEDVLPGLISHIGPNIKIKDSVFSGITPCTCPGPMNRSPRRPNCLLQKESSGILYIFLLQLTEIEHNEGGIGET